jgi:hypothetical protein
MEQKQFYVEWVYDLCVSMDEVMDNFNIQYDECCLDIEDGPEFSFSEDAGHIRRSFWWFSIIIEQAFGHSSYEYDYEEIPGNGIKLYNCKKCGASCWNHEDSEMGKQEMCSIHVN